MQTAPGRLKDVPFPRSVRVLLLEALRLLDEHEELREAAAREATLEKLEEALKSERRPFRAHEQD